MDSRRRWRGEEGRGEEGERGRGGEGERWRGGEGCSSGDSEAH